MNHFRVWVQLHGFTVPCMVIQCFMAVTCQVPMTTSLTVNEGNFGDVNGM